MGEKQTILQHYFIDGWGIKKIARELEIARNMVREYIREFTEKGHVERSVDYVRRVAFSARDIFDTEQEAMDALSKAINDMNADNGGMEEERAGLLPKMPDYTSAVRGTGLVDKWSTVVTGTNHYSVPDFLVGKEVAVQSHIDMVIVKYKGDEVARHEKSHGKKQFILDIHHYKETLRRKPGALNSSLCLKQAPKVLQDMYNSFFKEDPRGFIAAITEFYEYSVFQIYQACESLRDSGVKAGCEAIRMVLMNNTATVLSWYEMLILLPTESYAKRAILYKS